MRGCNQKGLTFMSGLWEMSDLVAIVEDEAAFDERLKKLAKAAPKSEKPKRCSCKDSFALCN